MNKALSTPAQWAQEEFALAQLGDQRRTDRLVKIAAGLAHSPGGTLPQAFPEWKELKAAYRFFNQPQASYERILTPHWGRTLEGCRVPGEYLLIEDTSLLDYTKHPATEDLGMIGDGGGRGFYLHSTLAVRVEAWDLEQRPEGVVIGLLKQQCVNRWGHASFKEEKRRQRLMRSRMSERWAGLFDEVGGPPEGSQWIYIADRESDCYETIERCQRRGVDFLIRACQNRRLAEGEACLREAVAKAPVLGRMRVELRGQSGQSARQATVEARGARLFLRGPWRPGGRRPDFAVNVVEVREVEVPAGAEPLCWILLSSLPCERWAEVQRLVGRYTARWLVEEYHKALKSGTRVEQSQLERAYRLESLVAVLALVAVRLLNTKLLARGRPESYEAAENFGPEMLRLLDKKLGEPKGGWTNRNLIRSLAKLGGFIGRKSDGEPGWQTIWRGWQRLIWMCEGVNLIES